MRQSQAEIKAIEAELRSIRADKALPHSRSVTLLEPDQIESSQSELNRSPSMQPISPTIQPSVVQAPSSQGSNRPVKPVSKRSVECFPVPQSNAALNAQVQSTVEQLRQAKRFQASTQMHQTQPKSAQTESVQRFKQVQTQFLKNASQKNRAIAKQILAEKAEQINHLSNQQEMIILELIKISEQLEQDSQKFSSAMRAVEPVCEYVAAEVPYVETDKSGTLVLTTRTVDGLDFENESIAVAQSLRQRTRKLHRSLLYRVGQIVWQLIWNTLSVMGTVIKAATTPIRWLVLGRTAQEPSALRRKPHRGARKRAAAEASFTLKTALVLVAGSALLRVLLDWVVASHPVLWFPSVLIMLTPALTAVYRSTAAPQGGFVWGYRLFAIMIGLLLGGRLL